MNTKPVKSILGKYGDYLKKAIAKSVYNSYEKKCLGKIESDAKFFMQFEGLNMNPQEYFLMRCYEKKEKFLN